MPRLFYIAVLLVGMVSTGFSSRQYFKGVPVRVAPIANTESFYAVDVEDPSVETNYRLRKTLVRLEPDGTIHTIREIDTLLEMSEELATEDAVVMYGNYGIPPRLYTIATGELSAVSQGYKYNDNSPQIEGCELDSVKMHPLVKDLPSLRIFRLPQQDCYLVTASVPGTGGCTSTSEVDTVSGYGSETFYTRMPNFYWSLANLKRNTLTKLADNNHPSLSGTGKVLMFKPYDENGKYYPRFVHLEEYVK